MSARRRDERAARAPAAGEPAPLAWLETLEARVHDAVERLGAATAENARLRQRVAELEARLAAGEGGEGGEGAAGDEAEREAWRREREEVRRRVARLADSLEELLGED